MADTINENHTVHFDIFTAHYFDCYYSGIMYMRYVNIVSNCFKLYLFRLAYFIHESMTVAVRHYFTWYCCNPSVYVCASSALSTD